MKNILPFLSFSLLLNLSPLSVTAIPIQQHQETVVEYLVGIMETTTQSDPNAEPVTVRMITCRVRVEQPIGESIFLYQEQALNDQLLKPYRQRFLEIIASEDQQVIESKAYKPEQLDEWVGFCDRQETERVIKITDLGEPVCSVFLRPLLAVYVGETPPGGCPGKVRGAVKITNTIILHARGMETWDRGFDADNNQVWGAKDQSYQFHRVR